MNLSRHLLILIGVFSAVFCVGHASAETRSPYQKEERAFIANTCAKQVTVKEHLAHLDERYPLALKLCTLEYESGLTRLDALTHRNVPVPPHTPWHESPKEAQHVCIVYARKQSYDAARMAEGLMGSESVDQFQEAVGLKFLALCLMDEENFVR